MCRLNNRIAYYKASTKTKIQHKNSANTQKQNTKKTKQKNYFRKNQYKRSTRARNINPEKRVKVGIKINNNNNNNNNNLKLYLLPGFHKSLPMAYVNS